MKITLINSPLQDYGKTKRREYYTTPPLGLGYLGTIARMKGCDVDLIDAEALGLSPGEVVQLVNEKNPDVVGINLTTPTLPVSRQIIQQLKVGKIIAGGPDATIRHQGILEEVPQIDMLVRGEGESPLEELIENGFDPTNISGVSYRFDGKIVHNESRPLVEDLDSLPFIDRSLFVNDPYIEGNSKKAVVMGSRGCPYLCSFCAAPNISGRRTRARSIDNVMQELELLNRQGVNSIHFLDNDLTHDRMLDIADGIEKYNLRLRWRGLTRVTISKYGLDFFRTIKKSGCDKLVFGIESGSQRILDLIQKGTTPDEARLAIQYCKQAGIKTKAYYIFGFPTETLAEMEQTLSLARELDTDTACFVVAKAYPGTEMYRMLRKTHSDEELLSYVNLQDQVPLTANNLNGRNLEKYHISNDIPFCEATNEQLQGMLRKAYNVYYANGRRRMVA